MAEQKPIHVVDIDFTKMPDGHNDAGQTGKLLTDEQVEAISDITLRTVVTLQSWRDAAATLTGAFLGDADSRRYILACGCAKCHALRWMAAQVGQLDPRLVGSPRPTGAATPTSGPVN
jgi:hypothetical protein